MLYNADHLRQYDLLTKDDQSVGVADFYFDDRFWTVRYLVLKTGGWLVPSQVLVSPYAVAGVSDEARTIRVNLTKEQIENSPTPDTDPPVSRQFETSLGDYYGWPYYWYGSYIWGAAPQPVWIPPQTNDEAKESWDHTLRSSQEVRGYSIAASDGPIGHVAGFIIDGDTWTIRYLVVDPRSLWPGPHTLVSSTWVEKIEWEARTLSLSLDRETIKQAPEYDSDRPITREYETQLHLHYSRQGYWTQDEPLA